MLPAQPPKSRRNAGTKNETFRICNCSGRICSENRPSKFMMVSNANEPQMMEAIRFLELYSGIKSKQTVAGDLVGQAGGFERQDERCDPLWPGCQGVGFGIQLGIHQDASNDRLIL